MSKIRNSAAIAAAVAALLLGGGIGSAHAEMVVLKATLSAASEVPPTVSQGTGTGTFSFDTVTRKLDYDITYTGLSGPATAAHIHSPAAPGANARPAVPFENPASPIKGSATLIEAQATELLGGLAYVNIHTAANGGGEIRGQILK